jgi:hypothetical protein
LVLPVLYRTFEEKEIEAWSKLKPSFVLGDYPLYETP